MKLVSFFLCAILCAFSAGAETIPVKNIDELKAAEKRAQPGDVIVLQSGEWKNVKLVLNCSGVAGKPITFRAETNGKVFITGNSRLSLGGNFITVDGLYFTRGYAGDDAVIDLRSNKSQVANNCRITNCVIDGFNNPKRLDENYWLSLSGKNNRIDHCSFLNKNNMGVLMAVLLDDDRSRENFHSIDHNYFGRRQPLASNTGEIIRVGVSQHCEFNSNTQITDNFFEHCDGETEIVSIKSGSNTVRNNVFKECQGGVVLRHGNYNTVENNIFLGNGKDGTGGVRVINKGQWVVNNYFYQCRGEGFRSPLSLMNGVFNSPANRYVAVTDAVIANNSFNNCAAASFCEGSDTERTVVPSRVVFQNNSFFTTDQKVYNTYDDISKISFAANAVSPGVPQELSSGFEKVNGGNRAKPGSTPVRLRQRVSDSLKQAGSGRLQYGLSEQGGYNNKLFAAVMKNTLSCGAAWYKRLPAAKAPVAKIISAADGAELVTAINSIDSAGAIIIRLTGSHYSVAAPLLIRGNTTIVSDNHLARFTANGLSHVLQVQAGSSLRLEKLSIDLSGVSAPQFITSDVSGSSAHSLFAVAGSDFSNYSGDFFSAAKSSVLDSVEISRSVFKNMRGTVFNFNRETDKKGYYNTEKLRISNCKFTEINGQLLGMLRGGNDESTMGPLLVFQANTIENSGNPNGPFILLNGTQRSSVTANDFRNTAKGKTLIEYVDAVRAAHLLADNIFTGSGSIEKNKFTTTENNSVK